MESIEILGIDPGSQRTGWGIIRDKSGVLELVDCGIIRTKPADSFSVRLSQIYRELCAAIARCQPGACAVEQVFSGRNPATALKLGQARGAAIAACAAYGLEVFDYEPTLVKKAVTGGGRAEKEQVAFMVSRLLNLGKKRLALDTTDALAVAICHAGSRRLFELGACRDRGAEAS